MNDKQLKQFLFDADAAALPPATANDLAKQVIRRAHRRSKIRGAVGIGATLVLAGMMAWHVWRPGLRPQLVQRPQVTPTRREASSGTDVKVQLARLEIDAELHQSLAVALLRAASRQDREAESTRSFVKTANLAASFAETRDETAHLMIVQADRLLSQPDGRSEAIATYRRVTELFPASPGASAARRRLQQLRA